MMVCIFKSVVCRLFWAFCSRNHSLQFQVVTSPSHMLHCITM